MSVGVSPPSIAARANDSSRWAEGRTVESYEFELDRHRGMEAELRAAIARADTLLGQQDTLLRQQELRTEEADQQMIVSLLSLQSRAAENTYVASQLAIAARRVATIERIHRRLHDLDGARTILFRHYLEDLCCDFSTMSSTEEGGGQAIVVEGMEIKLPTVVAVPLGFVVSELIMNALKHGGGRITVGLEPHSRHGYALSVSNEGPALPEGFDPATSRGLGMKIIRSFVDRIGGELRFGRDDGDQGARVTVLFGCEPACEVPSAAQ